MNWFRRLKVGAVLWIVILIIIAAQPLHSVAQSLKFGYTAPATSPQDTSARQLAAEVERASKGKLKVAVFPAGSLGPAGEVMEQVRNGSIDFALIPTPLLARSVLDFEVFELPFLFEDYGAVRRFQSSDAGVKLLQRLEGLGLKGLAYWHGPMKVIAARKPVADPSDLKGLKLAQQGPKTRVVIAFERLGANVTPMQFGELYNALQTGVVDAAESTIPAIEQTRLFEVDKYVTVTNHSYVAYVVVASMKTWSSLSPQDRGVVEKAIAKITPEANSLVVNQLGETFKALSGRAEFTTLSKTQRDAWRRSVDSTWKEFSASSSREQLVRVALASGTGGGGDPCQIDQCRCSDRSCSKQCCSPPPPSPPSPRPPSPPPSPPPPPSPLIVYNADISPQLPRDNAAPNRPVLQAGQAATLRFGIGPKWEGSLLPDATPSSDILQSKEDVPLTVVVACGFCEPGAEVLKRMTYMPKQGRSDEIRFQFTPQRRQNGNGYTEKLQLAIINDQTGREYDRLVVPVAVAGDGAPIASGPSSAVAFVPSKGVDRSDWRPDVLLYANEEMGSIVTISIQPVSGEMKKLLGALALDAEGVRKVFRSGIDDVQLLDAMTNSAYGAMSAVSMQGEFLKKLSATGTDAAVSKASQDSLVLTDIESRNVAGVIAQTGQRLYRRLFYSSADLGLRTLIVRLEAIAATDKYKDRPLRMMVITNRLSLPWQYLHPVSPDVDAAKFWGIQFSLSVLRVNNNAGEKTVAPAMEQVRKFIFARSSSSADPTVPLAEKQAAQLLLMPLAEADLVKVDTGADLLAKVSAERKRIAGIVTFLHASAGSGDTVPHLEFNTGDIVTSDSLENLLNKVPPEEQDLRYLAGGPLVILNACETGPARNLPHVKLENAMFQLGAQGVVVTEVSVWITLGHEVATRLIARLSKGEAVSDALTATRRDLYAEKKNPLGLLYVYYGDPAATLRH